VWCSQVPQAGPCAGSVVVESEVVVVVDVLVVDC
jgi:hypothetical protein